MDEINAREREAEGRIKVKARHINGAVDGWFKPGSGKTEWFKDHGRAPEMVVVPAGVFMMGSGDHKTAKPSHKVTIRQPFAVGRFAVTFAEWDAAGLPGTPDDAGWGRGKQPVINVSWEDAKAYVSWLSQETGKSYRLLSEAEWEFVARAGTTTAFWWGDSFSILQGNYYDHDYNWGDGPKGQHPNRTVPVDRFEPNPWGLYQVHGNVLEWCEDSWHLDYEGAPQDGSVWPGGHADVRVLRGGPARGLLWDSAARTRLPQDSFDSSIGFRLARTLLHRSR
jgi:formylglycine-generating enzyme required for sulfatase activity